MGRIERFLSTLFGPLLLSWGVRRRGLTGLALAGSGASALHRGVTGWCWVYEKLGIDTTEAASFRGVDVRRAITINATPQELYERWRDLESLPRILSHVQAVDVHEDFTTSHWVARVGPYVAEWDAEIVIDEPGRRLAWQTLPESRWTHAGDVTFAPATGGRGTELRVRLRIAPRSTRMLLRAAPLLRGVTRNRLGEELRRFKQLVETGEIATNAMRPSSSRATVRPSAPSETWLSEERAEP